MSWVYCNPNPARRTAGDCVVRGLAIVFDLSWDDAYDRIVAWGKREHEMPSANMVLDSFMDSRGYEKFLLPATCLHCYTVNDFANEHPYGSYLLGTGTHVVAVIDGDYYDTWDSGGETPIYYWTKSK